MKSESFITRFSLYNRNKHQNLGCLLLTIRRVQGRCHGDLATGLGRLIMTARTVTPGSALSIGSDNKTPPNHAITGDQGPSLRRNGNVLGHLGCLV